MIVKDETPSCVSATGSRQPNPVTAEKRRQFLGERATGFASTLACKIEPVEAALRKRLNFIIAQGELCEERVTSLERRLLTSGPTPDEPPSPSVSPIQTLGSVDLDPRVFVGDIPVELTHHLRNFG